MSIARALPHRRLSGGLLSLLLLLSFAACNRAQGATPLAAPSETRTALNVSVVGVARATADASSPAVLAVSAPTHGAAPAPHATSASGEGDSTRLVAPAQSVANPSAHVSADAPVRIVIPRAGVNAAVVPLGETDGGAMATPSTPTEVGWWQYGVAPGQRGSAVLGGHLDFHDYGAAVFWNLNKLRPGDEVDVTNASGVTLRFVVRESAVYQENDASVIDRIFRQQDAARLNLITCAGTFNPATRDYDKRLVVYTVLAH